jgi:surface antigen
MTLDEFIKKYTGVHNVGNTTANKGECTGLVMVYIESIGLSHIWGHAKDIFNNASLDEYSKIENKEGAYPVAGDIIIWDSTVSGGYGHIAIVVSSDPIKDTVTVFEQNNPIGSAPTQTTYKSWGKIVGWLHPIKFDAPIESCETDLEDMRKSREAWKDKCNEYEGLNKTLSEQAEKDKETIKELQGVIATNKTPLSEYGRLELLKELFSRLLDGLPKKNSIS